MAGKSAKRFFTTLPGILTGIAAVIAAIAGLIAAFQPDGDGPQQHEEHVVQPQKRTWTKHISSQGDWQSVGIFLQPGQSVEVEASGSVQYSHRTTAPNEGRCGPDGVPPYNPPVGGHSNDFRPYCVVEEWNHAALIARVGAEKFRVGTGAVIPAGQGGSLEFKLNDTDEANNIGQFRVVITEL